MFHEYKKWKQWTDTFSVTTYWEKYYSGEFRGHYLKDRNILEIGFGEGHFMAWAVRHEAKIWGIEVIPELVSDGAEKGFNTYINNEFNPDKFNKFFDYVVAFDVFEHLTQDEMLQHLSMIEKILRDQGSLILSFPNGSSPFGRELQYGDITHLQVLTASKIEQALFNSQLEVELVRDPYFMIVPGKGVAYRIGKIIQWSLRKAVMSIVKLAFGMRNNNIDAVSIVIIRKVNHFNNKNIKQY